MLYTSIATGIARGQYYGILSALHGNPIINHKYNYIQLTLLSFVAKTTSFVRSSGMWRSVDRSQLSVLPHANSQQKAHDIALLLPVQLLDVLVRTHPVYVPIKYGDNDLSNARLQSESTSTNTSV